MKNLKCNECGNDYEVIDSRTKKSKFCSRKCSDISKKAKENTICTNCGNSFHIKESGKIRYKRSQGYFCSTTCVAQFRKKAYLGENNPNWRNLTVDYNGYTLSYLPKFGRIKLHHKVVFEYLNIDKVPAGYCVHHRDCNINNNDPQNLAVITHSDHKWLHKNFGNATLWAFYYNLVDLSTLISWSRDMERSKKLLPLSILDQVNQFNNETKSQNQTIKE
jgi:hypothetical protein